MKMFSAEMLENYRPFTLAGHRDYLVGAFFDRDASHVLLPQMRWRRYGDASFFDAAGAGVLCLSRWGALRVEVGGEAGHGRPHAERLLAPAGEALLHAGSCEGDREEAI
jgi:hypothetical protein